MSFPSVTDPAKTIILVNGSVAQSNTDALDWCARRGVPTTNIVAANFGTRGYAPTWADLGNAATFSITASGLSGYVGLSLLAMRNLAFSQGFKLIVGSTWTPHAANLTGVIAPAFSSVYPLMNILASGASVLSTVSMGYPPAGDTPNWLSQAPPSTDVWPYLGSDLLTATCTGMAAGRLGIPRIESDSAGLDTPWEEDDLYVNGVIQPSTTVSPATGLTVSSLYNSCVTGALAAEAQNNLSKLHVTSSTMDRLGGNTWKQQQLCRWLARIGVNYTDVPTNPLPNGMTYSQTYGEGILFTDMTGAHAPLQPFGWLTSDGAPNAMDYPTLYIAGQTPPRRAVWENNFRVLPGGWFHNFTSYSLIMARGWLRNGGAAAVSTVTEPGGDGVVNPEWFMRALVLYQMPMAYAAWACSMSTMGGLGNLVFGDPLYAPYKASSSAIPSMFIDRST